MGPPLDPTQIDSVQVPPQNKGDFEPWGWGDGRRSGLRKYKGRKRCGAREKSLR